MRAFVQDVSPPTGRERAQKHLISELHFQHTKKQKVRHTTSNTQRMRRISRYQFSRAHASITSYSHPSSTRHSSIWGRLTNGSTVRHKSDGPEAFGKVNNNHTANPRFISSAPLLISGQERKDLFRLLTNNWSLTPDETGLEKSFEFRTFRECWVRSTTSPPKLSFSIKDLISRQ